MLPWVVGVVCFMGPRIDVLSLGMVMGSEYLFGPIPERLAFENRGNGNALM